MGLFEDEKISRELDAKMTKDSAHIARHPEDQTPYAAYLGEQDDGVGGHFSLYNITGGFYHGTTLSEKAVKEKRIMIK
jgi:hypothetical protein